MRPTGVGAPFVPHDLDPSGPGWLDVENPQTTGGQTIFAGRVNIETGIIIDVSPSGESCFVQVNLATSVYQVAQDLRGEVSSLPHSVLMNEADTAEGHGTIFGLVDTERTEVPIFAINDSGQDGAVMTAIVALGSKGN